MDKTKKTVLVGMSGGVDSTLAAYILKQSGYNVVGITMKIWDGKLSAEKVRSGCYGPGEAADIEDAGLAAGKIGIPYYVADMAEEYRASVIKYFRSEYLSGRTPNPCVMCNQKMKFGMMLKKAGELGIDFDLFATGHYASVRYSAEKDRYILCRGADSKKDQSYFLYRLTQEQLKKCIFPLGGFTKKEVQAAAAECGFDYYAEKPESQDFYEGAGYGDFFRKGEMKPGDIIDEKGRIIGKHDGLVNYTVGQRKGLGIGGSGEPLYVLRIDACSNRIVAGPRSSLFSSGLAASRINWISSDYSGEKKSFSAKLRSHQPDVPCKVFPGDKDSVRVVFDEPQMAVTPGQSVVFYSGDEVAGGGIIDSAEAVV